MGIDLDQGDHSGCGRITTSGTPTIVRFVAKTLKAPYTSVTDVGAFFERVQTIAEPKPPKKVDSAWVESYQFKTAHPSAIPSMLRWLNVIDDEGESTGVWDDLRVDGTRETTLAKLVREAYKAVFDAVDVEKATSSDLRGAFVSAYSIGDPGRHIKCFLALCQQARIETAEEATSRESTQSGNAKPKQKPKPASTSSSSRKVTPRRERHAGKVTETTGVNVTLNVEIPADWSEEEILDRIAVVSRALGRSDQGDS